MRRLCIMFVALALLAGVLPGRRAAAQAGACFPETNQCIQDRFRQYWEQNGGLPVFGFPITAAANETNRDTGQTYLTQWFQRNRFELHTENAAPYDVLLGRLGDDRLRQQGRDWQTFPKAQPAADHYFRESGHAIDNVPFWTYWSTHGLEFDGRPGTSAAESLALFGLPISEPAMETNASGDNVLTQWFERARFEYHPNNPDPFKVLLGLLGDEVRSGSGTPPPPGPPPTPTAQPTPAPGPTATPSLPPPSFNNCQADPTTAPNYPVRIMSIDKAAEVVTLRNVSDQAVNLDGWTMCSVRGNQRHAGIGGTLAPGETKAFPNTGGEGTIWNNFEEDDGALYNANGQLVSFLDA